MQPKIVKRQSVMFFRKKEKTVKPIVPMKGMAAFLTVVIPFERDSTESAVIRTDSTTMTSRNSSMSSSNFGKRTMIAAPSIEPIRDFLPPMITASRNRTLSSITYVLGEIYCSEYE